MTRKPKILLIYTGGTIGMIKDYETNALKAFNFDQIKDNIPELRHLNCEIDSFSFEEPIDSSNMNPDYYIQIAEVIEENYNHFDGFVILTGSDTMAYASSALSFMLEHLAKPVIFAGSQLPIGHLRTDAKENLITSIEIAASLKNGKPVITEVCLYFEYKLYRANRTTKVNAEQFEAFASMNHPPLAESGVHLYFNQHLLFRPEENKKLIVRKNLVKDIVVVKLFPGMTENVLQSILDTPYLKGVILETFGAGNAMTDKWFITLLEKAVSKGIYIVNVTQCLGGSVIMGHYETSVTLEKIGIIAGKDITTEAAVAKMMYLLGLQLSKQEFRLYFEKSLRGEINIE